MCRPPHCLGRLILALECALPQGQVLISENHDVLLFCSEALIQQGKNAHNCNDLKLSDCLWHSKFVFRCVQTTSKLSSFPVFLTPSLFVIGPLSACCVLISVHHSTSQSAVKHNEAFGSRNFQGATVWAPERRGLTGCTLIRTLLDLLWD